MRSLRIILPLFVLCSIFMLTSCDKENSCADEVTQEEVEVAYYYNAYYDLFQVIESFNFEELAAENILIDKGPNAQHAVRYELNFPTGYVDANGNILSGRINYYSINQVRNSVGNQITYDFDDFGFNGVDVAGEKIIEFASETETYWWSELGVVIEYNNETTVFGGRLAKVSSGGNVLVSGANSLIVNNVEYVMEITEPILKNENCSWFTSGELAIKGENTRMLKFEEGCEGIEMSLSNEEGCHSVKLVETHNFW